MPLAYRNTRISITDVNGGYWHADTFDHARTGRWARLGKSNLRPSKCFSAYPVFCSAPSLAVAATTTTTKNTHIHTYIIQWASYRTFPSGGSKSPQHSCYISMLVKTLNINKPPQSVSIYARHIYAPKKEATKNAQKTPFLIFPPKTGSVTFLD